MHLIASLALLSCGPQGIDWPQYRGPDRSGAVAAADWSAIGRDTPLWTRNVGLGYSCPSVAGGRLVTMGYDEAAGLDRVVCLDAITGEDQWTFEFAASDQPMYHGGGTLTTPTIRDGLVYCLNRHGAFHVLDLETGAVEWSKNFADELQVVKTFHGFSASPLLDGDRIYLQLGGRVVAAQVHDGRVLWQSEDRGDASYADLARITVNDQPSLAAVLGTSVVVLRLADGQILHDYPWPIQGNAVHCAVPIQVGEDRLFVSTAYGKGCEMLRLGDALQPERVWGHRLMRNKVTACVLHDGHLYGFDESMLRCIDTEGNATWRVRGLGLGSLSMAGHRLLVLTSDGELIVAEANPDEFRELSRRKVLDGGVYWTTPVFVDGLIYVRNSLGDMACLDHRLGAAAPQSTAAPDAPTAESLFEQHAARVGAAFADPDGKALQLRGSWAVPLRGLSPSPMTWTLVGPDRWDLRLDAGGFRYTFDGERAWALEPQGPRLVLDQELEESRQLFPLATLFAPRCPQGASVHSRAVRFAETDCWKVSAPTAGAGTASEARRHFFFAVGNGALVGSEGDGCSTLVFRGAQELAGGILPESVTRFRAEDGQEHNLVLTAAEWIEPPATLLELPAPVRRLLRTPAEIARDTAALRERFGFALARYKPGVDDTPLEDDTLELQVRDGELWLVTPEPRFRVDTDREADGVFPIVGPPIRISLETDAEGQATTLIVLLQEPQGEVTVRCERLPR